MLIFTLVLLGCGRTELPEVAVEQEWPYYLGSLASQQYSALDQITPENVNNLTLAWSYAMEDHPGADKVKCNPLIIDGVLYGTTDAKDVVALDAKTGEEKWLFKPRMIDTTGSQGPARGLTYWEEGDDKRLFYVFSRNLYAIDATTGQLVDSFGENCRIPYHTGLATPSDRVVSQTTPGVIYRDLLIAGSFVSEYLPAAPGDIRAFNVRTGEVEWVFHTIPHPGEFGYVTWPPDAYKTLGGANSWAGMSLDEDRGIVYVPTASPTYDFYGANRPGANLFGNCLLALDAATGERIWHYQLVHHDLWDRDLPCPPNLITVTHDGREIDAVAQVTKQGYVYLFDRETGTPLFDIEEVPVPTSLLASEHAWPTQPVPVKPPPFARQEFREEDVTTLSPEANAYVRREYAKYTTAPFSPASTEGTIVMPFFNGGGSWGGTAYDEASGLLYINANDMPWLLKLVDLEQSVADNTLDGSVLYQRHCASCHGEAMEGGHYVPELTQLNSKYSFVQVDGIVRRGKGVMPAMGHLSEAERWAILSYVLGMEASATDQVLLSKTADEPDEAPPSQLRYTNQGYTRFNDPEGYPAIQPPWGTLTAIDMNRGEIAWQQVLGEYEELTERGIPPTGTRNEGGPIVTRGGLVFIAATFDQRFRAFDKADGSLLWEYELPGSGHATPATYAVDGVQYVVLAVSERGEQGRRGKYMAFRLGEPNDH